MDPVVSVTASGTPRRAPIFGPEPWATIAGAEWCYFDQWFALVTVTDFNGDLDALQGALVDLLRSSLNGRDYVEAKLSHLTDLRTRLNEARIDTATLADAVKPNPATLTKARRKVLEQALDSKSMTPAMRHTPADNLRYRARYGHWSHFLVNPDRWYEKLAGRKPSTDVSKGRSFVVVERLSKRLANHDGPRRAGADRLALHRALQTVAVELADASDDSYGNVGEFRFDAFTTYLSIDWASTGMAPEHYWQDLCEFLVADDYALTHQHDTLPFQRVPAGQSELIEVILLGLANDYRCAYQDYQADDAVQQIAWLHIAGHLYTRYTEVAHRLGSDHWMPIVALAESALASGRRELAIDIFRAADRPGMQQNHLRKRCVELTGAQLDDTGPRLRIVR